MAVTSVGYHLVTSDDQVESRIWWVAGVGQVIPSKQNRQMNALALWWVSHLSPVSSLFSLLFLCTYRRGTNQTNDSTNDERSCTTETESTRQVKNGHAPTIHWIERELSICQSILAELTRQMTLPIENGPRGTTRGIKKELSICQSWLLWFLERCWRVIKLTTPVGKGPASDVVRLCFACWRLCLAGVRTAPRAFYTTVSTQEWQPGPPCTWRARWTSQTWSASCMQDFSVLLVHTDHHAWHLKAQRKMHRHQQNWPGTCHCRYQRRALSLLLRPCLHE